jgi:1-acyl-sn-glycerol-3-phosphate acyltransferase
MKETPLYCFARTFLPWLFRTLMPIRVRHAEYMPKNGPVVLCSNHMSSTDPLRLAYSQRRQIFFMAKEELFRNKFVACVIRGLGAFPVARGKSDLGAINLSAQHLKEDDVLGVFIEGTRSKDGKLQRPKPGAVMLASRCNAPILPCCITAKNGGLPKLFHPAVVAYGKPISPEELGVRNNTPSELRAASLKVMSCITELRDESLKEFH